jgi:hypothetical protein
MPFVERWSSATAKVLAEFAAYIRRGDVGIYYLGHQQISGVS